MDAAGIEAASRVREAFLSKGIRLSLAESCTGGYIAHLLTSLPGASDFLSASIVAYSLEAKMNILGVEGEVIQRHGMISPQCALGMAAGAARAGRTVAALSVTGNLGPEALEGRPVGLVYAAVLLRGRTGTREFLLEGDRDAIKAQAARAALDLLYEALTTWG